MAKKRTDAASRLISAPSSAIWAAFSEPGALEKWLPPKNMTATMLAFDFRKGGRYRMRLTHKNVDDGQGKTTGNTDEVDVRFLRLIESRRIEQAVVFKSDDPKLAGVMRMTWTFDTATDGTVVTVRAADVPPAIRQKDHEAGMNATLANLASFVGDKSGD